MQRGFKHAAAPISVYGSSVATRHDVSRRGAPRFAAVLVSAVLALPAIASAQVRSTIIGPGVKRFPIAISPLKDVSPGGAAGRFDLVLARDLELSGIFRVIPSDTYIENAQTSGITAEAINFENWSVIGALALVKGATERHGDELVIEARLFDVAEHRQLAGRRFRGRSGDEGRMANRFADEIIQYFTGERGPFDSEIVFLSTRGGRFKDVYVMNANGDNVRRITSANTLNLSPSWAPDRRSLIITSFLNGNPDLFSVAMPGGRLTKLSSLRGLNLGGHWSPDGRLIAVTLEYDGNPEIALLNPDGSLLRRLTDHWGVDVSPTWSPDGQSLAFCSDRSGAPQIYVMGVNGGAPRRVSTSGTYNTSPSWSPKGDRIAYASRVGGRFQIFTVKADGSDVQQVTTGAGSNEDPSWSPDGRYLVFSSTRRGAAKLYLSDAAGANQVQLTDGNGSDSSPSWSSWLE
jgi:TolB protein